MPYNDFRTNVLAIGSQTILVRNLCPAGMAVQLSAGLTQTLPEQVFSYFCTILLKLEDSVKGPYITENAIGVVMVGINGPLAAYFVSFSSHPPHTHLTLTSRCDLTPASLTS